MICTICGHNEKRIIVSPTIGNDGLMKCDNCGHESIIEVDLLQPETRAYSTLMPKKLTRPHND